MRNRCLASASVGALIAFGSVGGCSSDDTLFSSSGSGSSTATGASSSGGGAGACVPGQQIACACPGGASGIQACNSDGSGYEPCACEGTTGAGAGGATTTGAGGTGGGTLCAPGSTEPCYDGPAGTENVGLCVAGLRTCEPDGGAFGPCVGAVLPAAETCATPGDDDCDGAANEEGAGCACVPGTQAACYSGPPATENVGPCHGGTQLCNAAGDGYGLCVGEVVPQAETCNTAADDDCDGATNEEGAGCVCPPSSSGACYTGPAGTENVGTCKAGTHTCNAQGTAWGPCNGEVTPSPDLCASPLDEDCNGAAMPCVGAVEWSHAYGVQGQSTWIARYGVPIDAAGNILLAVEYASNVDLGGGPVLGFGLAKLDGGGAHLWSKGFANANGVATAVDGAGNILITGIAPYPVDLGGGTICAPDQGHAWAFIAKLDALGNHLWSKCFGSAGSNFEGTAVAADASGNVLWGGAFGFAIDFGAGTMIPPSTNGDAFLVKLSPGGTVLWSRQAGSTAARVRTITADGAGNVIATGRFTLSASFGAPQVTSPSYGLYVVKLDTNGGPVALKGFNGDHENMECAIGPGDTIALSGRFTTSIDLGGGPLMGLSAGGDAFVGKLDASLNHLWSKTFANGLPQIADGIATDPNGNIFVTGGFNGPVDFGAGFLVSAGGQDAFLVKLGPSGNALWSKRFGTTQEQGGKALGVDPVGAPVLGGFFQTGIDLGQGPFTAQGSTDAFLAKLAP